MENIDVLISGFFDDILSDRQFAELVQWINASEENATAFTVAAADHSNLRDLCHGDLVCNLHSLVSCDSQELDQVCESGLGVDAPNADVAEISGQWKLASARSVFGRRFSLGLPLLTQAGTLAAAMLIGGLAVLIYNQHAVTPATFQSSSLLANADALAPGLHQPQLTPIARLVDFGGDLQTDLVVPRGGCDLQAGQVVTISNGYGNVSFSSGVDLQLEGPLALEVGSATDCRLKYGRLIAKSGVLERFRISTTVATVVVNPSSVVGVATFGEVMNVLVVEGSVEIETPRSAEDALSLQEGDSYRLFFLPNGSVTHGSCELSRDDFPSVKSMGEKHLTVPQQYVQSVEEANPIAYWRFDRVVDEVVLNDVAGGTDLHVYGNLRFREASNNVCVDFGLHADTGFLATREPLFPSSIDDYSIELWANPTHCHSGVLVSIADTLSGFIDPERHGALLEFEGPGYAQWAVGERRRLRFLHRPELSSSAKDGTNLHPQKEYTPGHWHHICAVREGEDLRLFVDGALTASAKDGRELAPGLTLKIGQLYMSVPVRQFAGQIDEVAIYDRALSDDEVQSHYQLVRPE